MQFVFMIRFFIMFIRSVIVEFDVTQLRVAVHFGTISIRCQAYANLMSGRAQSFPPLQIILILFVRS